MISARREPKRRGCSSCWGSGSGSGSGSGVVVVSVTVFDGSDSPIEFVAVT